MPTDLTLQKQWCDKSNTYIEYLDLLIISLGEIERMKDPMMTLPVWFVVLLEHMISFMANMKNNPCIKTELEGALSYIKK